MNLAILCLFFVATALSMETMTHEGIMQVAKKSVIAKDMLYILKTIFQNAKFWDYPDIKEEEKSGPFSIGMYLTDMEVTSVELDINPLVDKLEFEPAEKKIILRSLEPVLKYTFAFKWKAEAMGIHVAFGLGNATFTSKEIMASYSPINKESGLSTSFKVSEIHVDGGHSLVPKVKDWVLAKLNNATSLALTKGIHYNVHFIAKYIQVQFKKLNKRINANYILQYASTPVDVKEMGNYLFYSHKAELLLNEKKVLEISEQTPIPLEEIAYDMGFFVSPQLIPLTMNVHGIARKCDGEFDMKALGLTGTIRDLFIPMPELIGYYTGNEKLKLVCGYAREGVEEFPGRVLLFPVHCNFTLADTGSNLLSAAVTIRMKYSPHVSKDSMGIYMARLSETNLQRYSTRPSSIGINIFIANIFREFAKVKFEGNAREIPMIRYEPYREYKDFVAEVKDGSYVAYYNDV